jgi:hypothetical protein
MKNIIIFCILILYSVSLIAQNKNVDTDTISGFPDFTALATQMVHSCDSNSRVTMICESMIVSPKKLPKFIYDKGVKSYHLNSKSKKVVFSFIHENNNKIILWLDGKSKYCFTLDSLYKLSFETYYLKKSTFEVYGTMRWKTFYRNFRVIFHTKENEALFDLDEGIFSLAY